MNNLEQYLNKIICNDALVVLKQIPDNSIDLVVADPPYNSKRVEWDKKNDEFQFSWLEQVQRILKPGGSLYVFFAPLNMYGVEGYIRNNFTLKNLIVWYHRNLYGANMSYGKDRYKSCWDIVFYAVKGPKAKHNKNVASCSYVQYKSGFDVMEYPQPRPLLHKAQKPLTLIERFIFCSSEENDVVLDPFAGSGVTLIASLRLNRNFIGIEIDSNYCDLIQKRLEKEKEQLQLSIEKEQSHLSTEKEQLNLFEKGENK